MDTSIDHRRVQSDRDQIDHWLDLSIPRPGFNDRLVYISANELAAAVYRRSDVDVHLSDSDTDSLARSAARCLSWYNDNHPELFILPWPAPVTLGDHRDNRAYNDHPRSSGTLFGRLPNTVDDSNRELPTTSRTRLIQDCPYFSDSKMWWLWKNWKDHLFYAVADSYAPTSGVHDGCADEHRCLTLKYGDDAGDNSAYAAILWFAGMALPDQKRGSRASVEDYLEVQLPADQSESIAHTFLYEDPVDGHHVNDVLYCLLPVGNTLNVISC